MSHHPIEVRPTVTTLEREAEQKPAPRMIHVRFESASTAFCGAKTRNDYPYAPEETTCVVCAELDLLHEAGLWP